MTNRSTPFQTTRAAAGLCFAVLTPLVMFFVIRVAPADSVMGDSQRIMYVHVPVAWFSLIAFLVMVIANVLYLRSRELKWDAWWQAAAEVGWLCCSLTLITGSFWAHEAWGSWWTWDPRLTTSFILWLVYSASLLVRRGWADAEQRAGVCAGLAVVGMVDLPLVTMATRWFRGIHPATPEMEPAMRLVLLVTACSFAVYLFFLIVQRQGQIQRQHEIVRGHTNSDPGFIEEPSWADTEPGRVYAGSGR